GQGEVLLLVAPAVLDGDDVLDLVGDKRLVGLPGVTVLAPVPGPLADAPADGGPDHGVRDRARTDRALAWRTARTFAPLTRASYSASSSGLSRPSWCRSARSSMSCWVAGSARRSAIPRATSGVRRSRTGSRNRSSTCRWWLTAVGVMVGSP